MTSKEAKAIYRQKGGHMGPSSQQIRQWRRDHEKLEAEAQRRRSAEERNQRKIKREQRAARAEEARIRMNLPDPKTQLSASQPSLVTCFAKQVRRAAAKENLWVAGSATTPVDVEDGESNREEMLGHRSISSDGVFGANELQSSRARTITPVEDEEEVNGLEPVLPGWNEEIGQTHGSQEPPSSDLPSLSDILRRPKSSAPPAPPQSSSPLSGRFTQPIILLDSSPPAPPPRIHALPKPDPRKTCSNSAHNSGLESEGFGTDSDFIRELVELDGCVPTVNAGLPASPHFSSPALRPQELSSPTLRPQDFIPATQRLSTVTRLFSSSPCNSAPIVLIQNGDPDEPPPPYSSPSTVIRVHRSSSAVGTSGGESIGDGRKVKRRRLEPPGDQEMSGEHGTDRGQEASGGRRTDDIGESDESVDGGLDWCRGLSTQEVATYSSFPKPG
ncbi:MAG: hypothetical protein Q9224_000453 [Gallowayella concinna]